MSRKQNVPRRRTLAWSCVVLWIIAFGGQAHGAIYAGNGPPIGRINVDGSGMEGDFVEIGPWDDRRDAISMVCGQISLDSSYIYWTDPGRDSIGRARRDGTEVEYLFIAGGDNPCGLAVNGSYIYWINRNLKSSSSTIGRARLDGSEVDHEFMKLEDSACALAVSNGHLYWTDYYDPIERADLSGDGAASIAVEAVEGGCGLAVDGDYVYWSNPERGIGRATLDGRNMEPELITGLERPCGVALHGGRVFWAENVFSDGRVGHASLDGSGIERYAIGGIRGPCGIAVDSTVLPPHPPPPPFSPNLAHCRIAKVRHNKSRGIIFVRVDGPAYGRMRIRARGLRWRIVSKRPPRSTQRSTWRWWVKMRPAAKGRVARKVRQRLRRIGRVPFELRIACSEAGLVSNTTQKRLAIWRTAKRKRHGHRRP